MHLSKVASCLFLSASFIAACGGSSEGAASPDEAKPMLAADYELRLGADEGNCVVAHKKGDEEGELKLALTPPCFLVTENGGVATRTFKDKGELTAVIVAGSAAKEGDKTCGKEGQALILRSASVTSSERVSLKTTYCEGEPASEDEFFKFTH